MTSIDGGAAATRGPRDLRGRNRDRRERDRRRGLERRRMIAAMAEERRLAADRRCGTRRGGLAARLLTYLG